MMFFTYNVSCVCVYFYMEYIRVGLPLNWFVLASKLSIVLSGALVFVSMVTECGSRYDCVMISCKSQGKMILLLFLYKHAVNDYYYTMICILLLNCLMDNSDSYESGILWVVVFGLFLGLVWLDIGRVLLQNLATLFRCSMLFFL